MLILLGFALATIMLLVTAMLAWSMQRPPRHTAGWAIARGIPSDPGDLSLQFEEWQLDRPDGITLPVWEISRRCESEAGAACRSTAFPDELCVVFIHGWGHSRIDMLQRLAVFLPTADRFVLYDQRGHGDATGLSRLGGRETDDLLALLDRLGEGRCVLVGHSMGAVVAIAAAIASQRSGIVDKIAGIVAYGPYLQFHRSLIGRLRVAGLPGRPITDLALLALQMRGVRPRSLDVNCLAGLSCPLLVIHGRADEVSPVEDGRQVAKLAAAAELLELPNSSHVDAHESGQSHDMAIVAFFNRLADHQADER